MRPAGVGKRYKGGYLGGIDFPAPLPQEQYGRHLVGHRPQVIEQDFKAACSLLSVMRTWFMAWFK
jgi:hypothetical protein